MFQQSLTGFRPAALCELPEGFHFMEESHLVQSAPGEGYRHGVTALVGTGFSMTYVGVQRPNGTDSGYFLWPAEVLHMRAPQPPTGSTPQGRMLNLHVRSIPLAPGGTTLDYQRFVTDKGERVGGLEVRTGQGEEDLSLRFIFPIAAYWPSEAQVNHEFLLSGAVFYTPMPEDLLVGSSRGRIGQLLAKAKANAVDKKSKPKQIIAAYQEVIREVSNNLTTESHGMVRHHLEFTRAYCEIEQVKAYIKLGRAYYGEARDILDSLQRRVEEYRRQGFMTRGPNTAAHGLARAVEEQYAIIGMEPGIVERLVRAVS